MEADNRTIDVRVKITNAQKDPKVTQENIESALKGQSFEPGELLTIESYNVSSDAQ